MSLVAIRTQAIEWDKVNINVGGKDINLGNGSPSDAFFEVFYDVDKFYDKYPDEVPMIMERKE